ncbi:hypothetical protein Tco_0598671 [Tanacetum coccineum]
MCLDYLEKSGIENSFGLSPKEGVNQCTSGFHGVNEPGGVRYAREDDRGVTEGREDVREIFQQHGSGAKKKLSRCGRNQMGNEPILALPEGADDFVVYYDARSKDLEACLEKKEKVIACSSRQLKVLMKDCMTYVSRWMKLFSEYGFEAKYHLGKANVVVESWSRRKSEAKNKFWIDCGLRFSNWWSSMKKDIASCGSKYLAYSEVEVEYQGSSRLLLQPELPE